MKVLLFAALIAVASAAQYNTDYKKPSYPAYPKDDYPAASYEFAWAVKDEKYNDFNQKETSDGKVVSGTYRVQLPDGRVQIVNYKADDYSGYVVDVKYEGEAKYDEYKPVYKAPAYPTPAYPVPTYPTTVYTTTTPYTTTPTPYTTTTPTYTKPTYTPLSYTTPKKYPFHY